ncbi:hypothetical protein CONCODRAFT_12591 [Conidiobolus coronatus NRRL 28638]|uniref:RNI-like protein n=1 Tax=Conidiobolus coronatus (strain ATCC 28846 / CBS 209.66 / NRRL 28638) TaxID=796925 RepID=A0A137NSM1_CONC2|nr:hypothetical protein CONCODRAFT_12591 [Conidiobolus coronatus NRRL 28638]|eukprot:KXN65734.1 hypothetical protein CONCODRAFT_12591 [Conidiobolus coronatus NRRL 28638]
MNNNNSIINWPQLSLSNQYLRYKLNPLVFRSISLSRFSTVNHLTNANSSGDYNHALEEYISYNTGDFEYEYDKSKSNDLENESMVKVFEASLIRIKKYVKSFKLSQLFSSCCFAFPLVYSLNNLEKLEIYGSSIYYSDLITLGDKFEKLKDLVLVAALIFNYEETELSVLNMPEKLDKIEMLQCKKYRNTSFDSIIDDIEDISNNAVTRIEMLFPISIPSLKRLRFSNFRQFGDYLKDYLKLNPQLETLDIISDFITQDQLDYIANECTNLTELFVRYDLRYHEKLSTPTFHYIKKLKFGDFGLKSFTMLQKLCENSPELDHLTLNINDGDAYSRDLDEFLKTAVPRFHKLSTLEINIYTSMEWPQMDFSELRNIQTLIIRSLDHSILEINANKLPPQRLGVKVECLSSGKTLNFINKPE